MNRVYQFEAAAFVPVHLALRVPATSLKAAAGAVVDYFKSGPLPVGQLIDTSQGSISVERVVVAHADLPADGQGDLSEDDRNICDLINARGLSLDCEDAIKVLDGLEMVDKVEVALSGVVALDQALPAKSDATRYDVDEDFVLRVGQMHEYLLERQASKSMLTVAEVKGIRALLVEGMGNLHLAWRDADEAQIYQVCAVISSAVLELNGSRSVIDADVVTLSS